MRGYSEDMVCIKEGGSGKAHVRQWMSVLINLCSHIISCHLTTYRLFLVCKSYFISIITPYIILLPKVFLL